MRCSGWLKIVPLKGKDTITLGIGLLKVKLPITKAFFWEGTTSINK